jgi:hypothetical protein
VPIYRLLQQASFDEADIRAMTTAYEAALELMRLVNRQDPLTELIAAKIIEVYQAGENNPPKLCARALKEMGVTLPD